MKTSHSCLTKSFLTLPILGGIFFAGCALEDNTPTGLAKRDVEALSNLDYAAIQKFDSANDHRFSKIFGGTSEENVQAYVHDRLTYYMEEKDLQILPKEFGNSKKSSYLHATEVVLGGLNLGTALWLQSVIYSTPVFLVTDEDKKPITSSRFGLMIFGPGYSANQGDKNKTPFPAIYRQGIIIHEARHSDCTGGLTQKIVQEAASISGTSADPTSKIPTTCGHLHAICPSGIYAGIPACDQEPWGAYGVQSVFTAAAYSDDSKDTVSWNISKAMAIDSFSRLLVPITGTPDMTSESNIAEK